MQAIADPASAMELNRDSQGWTWTVARPGRQPLQGRAEGRESARRTGRFAVEMLAAFDRIAQRSF
jgi:hypothetical protein